MVALVSSVAPPALAQQRDFFARHVEPWAASCLDGIEGAAAARFYRSVARWGRALCEVEGRAFAGC